MEKFDYKQFRNGLAQEIIIAPKKERKKLLEKAKDNTNYWYAKFKLNQEKHPPKEVVLPDFDFDLDNKKDFEEKITALAKAIYATHQLAGRNYDPYKGDMLCGTITDQFLAYLQKKEIPTQKVARRYEILAPDGTYNDNFGHVYFIIDSHNEFIMVDPTYLQWVSAEKRQFLPPVLVVRYKNEQEYKDNLLNTPIIGEELLRYKMALPLYLGFNSPEARITFNDNDKHIILSNDKMRID